LLSRDRIGAALMILIGLAAVGAGLSYRVGSLTRMGAGYFPVVLGTLLAAIGAMLWLGGRARTPGGTAPVAAVAPAPGWEWRAWLSIAGGVAAFVALGGHGGLIPATFAAVFIAALGDRNNSVRDAALLALAMVAAAAVIFGWALQLQLPLLGWE
jgi:hypothetical protein